MDKIESGVNKVKGLLLHRVNIDEPQFDQGKYWGRAKHFFAITNPFKVFLSEKELERCSNIVIRHKNGEDIKDISEKELWKVKNTYDSAFHPNSREQMPILGRMAAQVPVNMALIGGMLIFTKPHTTIIFWQFLNQTFNSIVNYSNRNGNLPMTNKQIGAYYVLATGGGLGMALGIGNFLKNVSPMAARFVPFGALAAATCVNVPMMRFNELSDGIPIVDEKGTVLGHSRIAAKNAISSVVFSRILMIAPGTILPSLIVNQLDMKGVLKRFPFINIFGTTPLHVLICGLCFAFATPMSCAIFPQKRHIDISELEPELQDKIKKMPIGPKAMYYNKGL